MRDDQHEWLMLGVAIGLVAGAAIVALTTMLSVLVGH
jgi:hypothetical protein